MGGQGFETNVAITGSSLYETRDMAKLVWSEDVERLSSNISECIIFCGEYPSPPPSTEDMFKTSRGWLKLDPTEPFPSELSMCALWPSLSNVKYKAELAQNVLSFFTVLQIEDSFF